MRLHVAVTAITREPIPEQFPSYYNTVQRHGQKERNFPQYIPLAIHLLPYAVEDNLQKYERNIINKIPLHNLGLLKTSGCCSSLHLHEQPTKYKSTPISLLLSIIYKIGWSKCHKNVC